MDLNDVINGAMMQTEANRNDDHSEAVIPVIRKVDDDALSVQLIGCSKKDLEKKLSSEIVSSALAQVEISTYLLCRLLTSKTRALEIAGDSRVYKKGEDERMKFYSELFASEITSRQDLLLKIKNLLAADHRVSGLIGNLVTSKIFRR